MALQVIEGMWEEIKRRESELAGRHLRVTVTSTELIGLMPPARKSAAVKKRLDALNAWSSLPRPSSSHDVDDSWEGICGYGEDGR